jgi:integrase
LFPGKEGTSSGYNSTWKRIVARAGLCELKEDGTKDYLHFHDLRHTATTRYGNLKPQELSVRENKYLLGHIIEKYEHVELVKSIRAKLDAAYANIEELDPPLDPAFDDASNPQDELSAEFNAFTDTHENVTS